MRHLSSCLRSQSRNSTFNAVKKRFRDGLAGDVHPNRSKGDFLSDAKSYKEGR